MYVIGEFLRTGFLRRFFFPPLPLRFFFFVLDFDSLLELFCGSFVFLIFFLIYFSLESILFIWFLDELDVYENKACSVVTAGWTRN